MAQAAITCVLQKKLLLKILQYSQENTRLESLYNKATSIEICNFIKKRLQCRCFPDNIAKFLRTPILKNFCEKLLLGWEGLGIKGEIIYFKISFLFGNSDENETDLSSRKVLLFILSSLSLTT